MHIPQRDHRPRPQTRVPLRRRAFGVMCAAAVAVGVLLGASACAGPTGGADRTQPSTGTSSSAIHDPTIPSSATAILGDFGYAGVDVESLVDRLDATPISDRPAGLMASVRPGELQLTGRGGRTASVPMPTGRFYLSIAPYVAGTHDCHFHSLTTCRGELSGARIDVTVRDDATGAVIAEGPRTTFDNGFVGLWLPRGIDATVTVGYQGKKAAASISTRGDDAATCLTTMRLS